VLPLENALRNFSTDLEPNSIEKHFGLNFGLKNGLRFHFYPETCLNWQFLNIFLALGNLKPKLEWFFKPNVFY